MTTRALLLGTALAFACAASAPAADLPKRQVGQIVYDNVPETPPELKAAIAPYYNARSAVFEDWLEDGSILIATRFGDVNQIHRVAAPGGARTQLTFFNEPVNLAKAQPGAGAFVYPRDVGGAEYYQAYLRSLTGAELQLTAPQTRNSSFVFSKDGKQVAWSQVTPGDPNYDIVLADTANPQGRRVVHEGTGAMAVEDMSADGKSLLLSRGFSAAHTELYVLDLASGALKGVGPAGRKIGYQGGAFTADGAGVITLSDDGSD
ncbi:MAG: TolB family protein, partial [Phenylobacterium sp.]